MVEIKTINNKCVSKQRICSVGQHTVFACSSAANLLELY